MRKRPVANASQLQHRAAHSEARKAANTLSHAVRLGKVPGVTEGERGDCATPGCPVEGRRFQRSWWDADRNIPGCGFVRSDGAQRCVICTSRQLGVVA